MKTSPSIHWPNACRSAQLLGSLGTILCLAGAGTLSTLADRATLDPTRTQVAFPLATPPIIDGTIDTAEWERAGGFYGDYWAVSPDPNGVVADGILGGIIGFGPAPADRDDLSFAIYAGYDDQYLYVAVRVRDSLISTDSAEAGSKNGNTTDDDSVEIYVDGNNANDANWSTANPGGQYVITANNAYRESEAGNPGYGETAAWYALTATTDTGYDSEFRISWATLGNPKPGDIIGFTVGVNDADADGPRQRQLMWIGETNKPVTYGNLLIGPRSYSAPLVSQAPVVDGKIDPAEYAGAQKVHLGGAVGLWNLGGGTDDTFPDAGLNFDWWVVHTADAVYVAASVVDDVVVTDTAEAGSEDGNTWEDDSVEIFFDADNSKNLNGPNLDFEGQYVLTANGAHRDNEARNPTFGASDNWFAVSSSTATGYQMEFKILKANLQNPTNGTSLGFMIAVNDDDSIVGRSVPQTQFGWYGAAHNEMSYGTLTLDGPPTVIDSLRISEIKTDVAAGNVILRWEGGAPQFQVEKSAAVAGPFQSVGTSQTERLFTDTGALKSALQNFYRIRQASTTPVLDPCSTAVAGAGWVNKPFTNQTGAFSVQFEGTPAVAPLDTVMALSSGAQTAYSGFACLVRFNAEGNIDARNAGVYEADSVIPYSPGVKYTFRLAVNIPAHTYSVFVTPTGEAEQTVATDFAFRTEQDAVTKLDYWGVTVDAASAGTNTVCNFKVIP